MLHTAGAHAEAADKGEKPEQGDEGESVDNARSLKARAGEEMRERQGEEQAAERRAGDVGELPDGSAQVTALTKCSSGTRWGTSAELAGPENERPMPMTNSTA